MFIDPEAGLPFDDVLSIVWRRKPDIYRRVQVVSERTGRPVEDIAREARDWMKRFLATASPARDTYLEQEERARLPFGPDPLLALEEEG